MSRDERPAAENVRYLEKGIELIRMLPDRVWTGPDGESRSGVGAQFRHCVDFYSCFLSGLAAGAIDYNARERDPRIEVERGAAIERMEQLVEALAAVEPRTGDKTVRVRLEASAEGNDAGWCSSSVLRELQFLLSHTIHHYALIVTLLQLRGFSVDETFADFGVAPSTLNYWKNAGSMTA